MKRTIGTVLLLLVSVGAAAAADLAGTAQSAISKYREQHGLPAVKVDPKLMQLAAEQARSMARAGVLEHDVDKPFAARIVRYDPSIACENIAAGMVTFSSALDIWKRSPGHNANLLRKGVTRIGIASANAPQSKYRMFWTLILAAPDTEHRPVPRLRAASAREVKTPLPPTKKSTHPVPPAPIRPPQAL